MSDKDELAAAMRAMKQQMTPSAQLVSQVMTSLSEDSDGAAIAPDQRAEPVLVSATDSQVEHVVSRTPKESSPAKVPTTPRRQHGPRNHRFAGMISGAVMAGVLAVAMIGGGWQSIFHGTPSSVPPTWVPPVGGNTPLAVPSGPGGSVVTTPAHPQGYAEIFQALTNLSASVWFTSYGGGIEDTTGAPAAGQGSSVTFDLAGSASSPADYVGTNTQVASIDEGDFVKTDGTNIYVAHDRTVAVVSASGGESRQIASIDISKLTTGDDLLTGPVADMMIDGQTLIVLAHGFNANTSQWNRGAATWVSLEASSLKTIFFSIADPAHPRLLSVLSQSGSLVDSRLSDGMLYLVSQYTVDTGSADPNDPSTIVPLTGNPGTPLPCDDIYIMPSVDTATYSLVTAIDVASRQMTGEQAVLGRTDTIYMSPDNLYLAGTQWSYDLAWAQERGLTIPGSEAEVYNGPSTDIVRISLADGQPTVAASASLAGSILNQFSLDEYQDHLRVVTTWNDLSNSRFSQTAALWVLDSSLSAVSSIPELAKEEGVKSARFDGPTAYVVTYRQVDPLFTIDLSDPAAPVVMSALKIPGFSTYLHVFGDGLLLGVGMDDGGVGLKISMFDVSDPYDVREVSMLPIEADYTDVTGDHHAAFVDVPNSLIGFPTTKWDYSHMSKEQATFNWDYRLYAWTGTQFEPQSTIDLLAVTESALRLFNNDQSVRGVRIADSFYIVTAGFVSVYDLATYAPQTVVTYS